MRAGVRVRAVDGPGRELCAGAGGMAKYVLGAGALLNLPRRSSAAQHKHTHTQHKYIQSEPNFINFLFTSQDNNRQSPAPQPNNPALINTLNCTSRSGDTTHTRRSEYTKHARGHKAPRNFDTSTAAAAATAASQFLAIPSTQVKADCELNA